MSHRQESMERLDPLDGFERGPRAYGQPEGAVGAGGDDDTLKTFRFSVQWTALSWFMFMLSEIFMEWREEPQWSFLWSWDSLFIAGGLLACAVAATFAARRGWIRD